MDLIPELSRLQISPGRDPNKASVYLRYQLDGESLEEQASDIVSVMKTMKYVIGCEVGEHHWSKAEAKFDSGPELWSHCTFTSMRINNDRHVIVSCEMPTEWYFIRSTMGECIHERLGLYNAVVWVQSGCGEVSTYR
jgi:hypothetical protein